MIDNDKGKGDAGSVSQFFQVFPFSVKAYGWDEADREAGLSAALFAKRRERLRSKIWVVGEKGAEIQPILPPSAALCCHPVQWNAATERNVMLPPSAITKGCAKSHPRRRRAVGVRTMSGSSSGE